MNRDEVAKRRRRGKKREIEKSSSSHAAENHADYDVLAAGAAAAAVWWWWCLQKATDRRIHLLASCGICLSFYGRIRQHCLNEKRKKRIIE